MGAPAAGWRRPAAAAVLAFLLTATTVLVVGAQLAPGWTPGPTLPPLDPDPLADAPTCPEGASTETALPGHDAWLVSPPGRPQVAVVLLPGAGVATRDDLLPAARALAACGIAAVTTDKVGGGLLRRDLVAGAQAVREVLPALRETTGADRVGVVGWSEGGWVAAHLLQDVDVVVTAGAPVVTPAEQLAWLADRTLAGLPDTLRRIPAAVLSRPAGPAWTRVDIRPLLAGSTTPVLGVWGSADEVVPVASAVARLREARPDASVLVLDGGDHELVGTAWAPQVATWLRDPRPAITQGVEPQTRHGIPALPRPTWATAPAVHLALALAAALVVGALVRSRTRRNP